MSMLVVSTTVHSLSPGSGGALGWSVVVLLCPPDPPPPSPPHPAEERRQAAAAPSRMAPIAWKVCMRTTLSRSRQAAVTAGNERALGLGVEWRRGRQRIRSPGNAAHRDERGAVRGGEDRPVL